MTNFDIFEDNFIDFCENHDFKFNNNYQSANVDHNSFIVLTGKNGIGKSRLLQLIREYIVTIKNQNYPYMIVRRLDYGEHDDDYDPDKTDHPLVTENILKCFGCDFDSWKILIEYLINVNDSKDYQAFINYIGLNSMNDIDGDLLDYLKELKKEYDREKANDPDLKFTDFIKIRSKDFTIVLTKLFLIQNKKYSTFSKSNSYANLLEFCETFFKYYLSKINAKKDENVIQNINKYEQTILDITEYEQKIYFDEFKKFYRRQILKKICYGSLKQMLMLNMRYQFDIDEINELITGGYSNYGLNFPYEIERINRGFVDKSDINERIIFNDKKKKIKFKDLSPGERLILHLIVLIKDRENIKMQIIDEQIKQVLLLDEPDSHCEANLVDKFIDFINAELVAYLNIQVIMTTHNYLTICKINENNLYVIKDKNDHLEIVKDVNKRTSFDILAKNLEEIFDLTNQSFEVRASSYKGISEACINGSLNGTLLENMFKSLTDQLRPFMIKIFLDISENVTKNEIDFISSYKELNECDLNNLNKKYSIIWPKNQTNKAWDFMIYQKNDATVNLFQITTDDSREKQKDTIKKHQNHKIEEKLKLKQNQSKSTIFKYFYISPGVTIEMHEATNGIIKISISEFEYELKIQNFKYFIEKFKEEEEALPEKRESFLKTREFFDYLIGINCSCKCKNGTGCINTSSGCTCLRNDRKCTSNCHEVKNSKCKNIEKQNE